MPPRPHVYRKLCRKTRSPGPQTFKNRVWLLLMFFNPAAGLRGRKGALGACSVPWRGLSTSPTRRSGHCLWAERQPGHRSAASGALARHACRVGIVAATPRGSWSYCSPGGRQRGSAWSPRTSERSGAAKPPGRGWHLATAICSPGTSPGGVMPVPLRQQTLTTSCSHAGSQPLLGAGAGERMFATRVGA